MLLTELGTRTSSVSSSNSPLECASISLANAISLLPKAEWFLFAMAIYSIVVTRSAPGNTDPSKRSPARREMKIDPLVALHYT